MMRVVVTTQCYENYAAHQGMTDSKDSLWKPKGGSEYVVAHLGFNEIIEIGIDGIYDIVSSMSHLIERDDCYFYETIKDYFLLVDGEIVESEEMQLEYEGCIYDPVKDFTADGPVCHIPRGKNET